MSAKVPEEGTASVTVRVPSWIGWSLAVACIVISVPTMVLLALQAGEFSPGDTFVQGGLRGVAFALASLAFAVVGALVVARVPGTPSGGSSPRSASSASAT